MLLHQYFSFNSPVWFNVGTSAPQQVSACFILAVVKRSGVSEPFNRAKVVAGVRRGCQGRPVDEDQLQLLAQQVEDAIRASGAAEVPSHEVGLAILRPLRELDEVAYLRFASVYRSFESLADFEQEIATLRAGRDAGDAEPAPVG